jgi:hypothetical protein
MCLEFIYFFQLFLINIQVLVSIISSSGATLSFARSNDPVEIYQFIIHMINELVFLTNFFNSDIIFLPPLQSVRASASVPIVKIIFLCHIIKLTIHFKSGIPE